MRADGVDAVSVIDHYPPGARSVKYARPDAGIRIAWLFKPGQIIDKCGCGSCCEVPSLMPIQGYGVAARKQGETFRSEFLIIIAWKFERIFGNQGEEAADA